MLRICPNNFKSVCLRGFHTSKIIFNTTTAETDLGSTKPNSTSTKQDRVFIKSPYTIKALPIDPKFRLGYDPIYISPLGSRISLIKRVALGIGAFGVYSSHLMFNSSFFTDEMAYIVLASTLLPNPLINFYTRNYVNRIYRLYDTTKPQTLKNLTHEETLVAEKISWTGRSFYNRLMKVQDLRLTKSKIGLYNWKLKEDKFYIVDDIGGIKMDRIWGIVEHNSGVDNGRFFGK
ncbi:hypothetical protein BN7_6315 [Wickerhamomyces ciferrii]|uniref:Uncharacterized protein n=1 Tax=Wickerhamomyces ciferrii (strain ATCC 14091 / BCRC 22168 / CBS 111 / JCM 3599 / NBRC 0793 / NRRL Y-1031 F-60-10) TaxID=1206466 RepID=K0L002_WICCF|nr:uncharacterized protein BN7_6315 [Wickerhamomyces ciferrii]CCH46718.1 hypothetical protein BN7_6315 [Wickerhamomyces ciferrii]